MKRESEKFILNRLEEKRKNILFKVQIKFMKLPSRSRLK